MSGYLERTKADHTDKDHTIDVRNLAYEMSKDSMVRRTKREVGHQTSNLMVKGLLNLFKGGLKRFNDKVTGQLAPAVDENIEVDDMHPDLLDLD